MTALEAEPERDLAVNWRPDGLKAQIRVVPTGFLLDESFVVFACVTLVVVVGALAAANGGEEPVLIALVTVATLLSLTVALVVSRRQLSQRRALTIVGSRLTIEGEGSWDLRSCRRVDAWKRSLGVFGLDGRPLRTLLLAHEPAVVAWLAEQLHRGIPDPTSKTAEAESRQARRELDALVGTAGRPGDR